MRKLSFIALILTLLVSMMSTGCDPYAKLAKSKNIADRDTAAMGYYKKGRYADAAYLFDQLYDSYVGRDRQELMYYYYSMCRYKMGELVSAAYYFSDFQAKYPNNEHVEEVAYMQARSYYLISDPHYLDQTYTERALDELQLFLSRYPHSKKRETVDNMLAELRERLARKSFEQANLYYKISNYKSAVESFKIMMDEFPDSKFREEAQYLLVKCGVKLADISIDKRKKQRYREAQEYAERFEEKFPSSKFADEVRRLKEDAVKGEERIVEKETRDEQEKLFNDFRAAMKIAGDRYGSDAGREKYEEGQALYQELRERFPTSEYLSKAEKVFADYEKTTAKKGGE